MVKFDDVRMAHVAKSTLLTSTLVNLGNFLNLLFSVQMLNREWGAESNRKLPRPFIPSKTATLFPEFAMGDLPLDRTATLVPAFAVKDLSMGKTL